MSDSFIIPAAVIGSGISVLLSVITYKQNQESKEMLKIPHFKPGDQELRNSSNTRLYRAVEGKVSPAHGPQTCKHLPECDAVIHKEKGQVLHNVGFHLETPNTDAGSVRVFVETPLKAEGDYLQQVHRRVEPTDPQRVREEALCVNSMITGIGDVVLGREGWVLQPPTDGRKFFLFSGGYESFKNRHERKCKVLKLMSCLGAFTGCALLGTLFYGTLNTERNRK